jgi:hypothetical protein
MTAHVRACFPPQWNIYMHAKTWQTQQQAWGLCVTTHLLSNKYATLNVARTSTVFMT